MKGKKVKIIAAAAVLLLLLCSASALLTRSIKVAGQESNNGYYCVGGSLYKLEDTLSTDAVKNAVSRINSVYEQYFADTDARAYYAVIPDKSYFTAEENGRPHMDYEALFGMVSEEINGDIKEISLLDVLDTGDYYRTDPHWSQPEIILAADALLSAMGADGLASQRDFTVNSLYPFYGMYYAPAELGVEPDTLEYLTDSVIDGVSVYNFETDETGGVYNVEDFENDDPYDVFLQGAAAILRIENPAQDNGRQLVLFRDSFGSSIAPLLISEYKEIIMVDIRYVSTQILDRFVEFESGCDVLFLYSTSVLNSLGAFMK